MIGICSGLELVLCVRERVNDRSAIQLPNPIRDSLTWNLVEIELSQSSQIDNCEVNSHDLQLLISKLHGMGESCVLNLETRSSSH